jgi:branched-chain amino acid transport system ATP-binding protein
MLRIDSVEAGYGRVQVLRGASLEVGPGERVGLFGPNGHGKTTLFRVVSGLIEPWSGTIEYDGKPSAGENSAALLDRGMVHVPQGNTLFPGMSVEENLSLGAFSRDGWKDREERMAEVFGLFPKLADRRGQLARTLSGGERQMVSIGIGIMSRPRMLLLDEPTLGLAPRVKDELSDAIGKIADSGVTLLLIDQDIEFLIQLTQRLYLLERGSIVLERKSDELLDDQEILSIYFGKNA